MEIKLFGRSLFKASKGEQYFTLGSNAAKETKFLPDFYKDNSGEIFEEYILPLSITQIEPTTKDITKSVVQTPKGATAKPTPREVYDLQMLNDKNFKLNVDAKYVDTQIENFKDKLGLLKSEEFDMRRGVVEISSILLRMENRKKYADNKEFFDEFPYTTTSKISKIIKTHDYLRVGQVAQFMADMPKEAVDVMKNYNKATDKLCGKQSVFYIIADKKDFKKTDSRRDPILLVQSPFGHFWQILGAWDKEMMFLEEL